MNAVMNGLRWAARSDALKEPHPADLLHYVGFRDDEDQDRYWNATRIFGRPDMMHQNWDIYAADDVAPGDTVVHANGEWDRPPRSFSTEAEQNRRTRAAERGTPVGGSR